MTVRQPWESSTLPPYAGEPRTTTLDVSKPYHGYMVLLRRVAGENQEDMEEEKYRIVPLVTGKKG